MCFQFCLDPRLRLLNQTSLMPASIGSRLTRCLLFLICTQIEKAVVSNELAFDSFTWEDISPNAKDFIAKCVFHYSIQWSSLPPLILEVDVGDF